jgi:hypothetical protein
VEGGAQDRDDPNLPVRPEVAEEDRLKLDGVLLSVRDLLVEQATAVPAGEAIQELAVRLHGAQRGVVRLSRGDEGLFGGGVSRSQDHEEIRRAAFGHRAVRGSVPGAPAVKIDVRSDQPREPSLDRRGLSGPHLDEIVEVPA